MKNAQAPSASQTGSKFSLGGFAVKGKAVISGKRVSSDTIAQIECQSQINKFGMNKLASELMGVGKGDRIKIIVTNFPELDGKFFVVKCADGDTSGAKVASATGKDTSGSFNFNYSGVYSQLQQLDVDAIEKSGEAFVEEGVAVAKSGTFYLDHKTIFEVVRIEEFDEKNPFELYDDEDELIGSYAEVFALIGGKIEKVDNTKETKPRKKVEAAENTESADTVASADIDAQMDAVED